MVLSSLNDFIDVQIDNTPNLLNARPLTSNCITPVLPNQKHSIKRRRILNAKRCLEKVHNSSYFTNSKGNKSNKMIYAQLTRNRNHSALGKETAKSVSRMFNSSIEGKYMNITQG